LSDVKKNEIKPWLKEEWCIPPKQNAEFVWHMEDVLDVYHRPYDPRRPMVCMDEKSVQLLGEVAEPLPTQPGQVAKEDHEYTRCGTANVFMVAEPLGNWRWVQVTAQRTRQDFAGLMKELLDGRYAQAEKVVLVMDNLNTHSPASFYEAFPPAEAKRLAERLEIHYTPKHGSWLNMAEIELSVLGRRLPRRIESPAALAAACDTLVTEQNGQGKGVDWQFTAADARIRLKRLYPSIEGK
jgi:hypothetical protein